MKVNPSQTRSLDRIVHQELGTGTSLSSEGSGVKLIPGEKDQIQISQLGNRLQILVNGSDKFLLTERESQNFVIQGNQKNISIDPSVSLLSNQNTTSESTRVPISEIPGASGQQLGQARRAESSLGAAVTRGMITDELKEDGYINHIGKQMQRLLGEIGISTPQPTTFRNEKDLLPFLKQLESISSYADPKLLPPNFQKGLSGTVQKIQHEINNGQAVDLKFLGSEISKGLKQIFQSKPIPSFEMQAGKIPFEAHEIPLGEDQRKAFEKWGMINEAINKNDSQMISEFANDPSFLRIALPQEKAAFINLLSSADKMNNLQNIIQILQSSQSTQELKSIVNLAGSGKLQNLFREHPAEFNFTAHTFQSDELVIPTNQQPYLREGLVLGFSNTQIFEARREMFQSARDDLSKLSENPLLLAIASPEEKASMIRQLQTGYVSFSDNRSIINILQSAMNKAEFDQIVNSAGGKAISLALQDPLSLQQWNRLAGAYDRMDLTTDFVEGVKYSNALLEPFPFEPGESFPLLALKAAPILRDQPFSDIAGIIGAFMKDASNWIGNHIRVLDRTSYVQAGLENLNHMMDERPLFDIPSLRHQLYSVLQKPDFNPSQILNQLQNFAESSGLSEYDMRNLISQPLAFVYGTAATQAEVLATDVMAFLKENLQYSIFQYGSKSPEAKLIEGQIAQVQEKFLPFAQHLRSISDTFDELFPAPADFIKSLSKFTSALNTNFAPLLTNILPKLSDVTTPIFENAQTLQRLINVQNSTNTPAPSSSPEILQIRSYLKNLSEGVEAIRNGNVARELSRVEQELQRVPEMPRELIQFAKQATSFFSAIGDGSYATSLKEVASVLKDDDPIAELVKTTAQNGAMFLSQLQNGTLMKVQEGFIKELDLFETSNEVVKLSAFFEKLTSLTNEILAGTGLAKISDEATSLISENSMNEFRGSVANIVKAAATFRNSPAFLKMIELLDGGAKFLTALSQGNFVQSMELMNSRFGYTPAIAQIIERGLHLTTIGSNVLKNLIVRDFERPIAQLTRKAQAKTQSAKEIIDAETVFATAATPFFALSEVENMNRLWQYHRQLDLANARVLADPAIKQFERQLKLLSTEPDLKKSLQKQFSSFEKIRSQSL